MENKNHRTGKALLIAFLALAIVFGVSFMPLEKWTGGRVKDFSLFRDILPDSLFADLNGESLEAIDPELLKAQQQADAIAGQLDENGNPIYNDTILTEPKPTVVDGLTVIEDYTVGDVGLYHFKKALAEGRLARMTVLGDSYIEGDIFTQNLRENLQNAYGGQGTGYMAMHSDFPGFRRSVRQGGQGWTEYSAAKKGNNPLYVGVSEHYYMPKGNALSTYKGTDALKNLDKWDVSRFLFIAPNATTIMVKTSADWVEYPVDGSPTVQAITVEGTTGEFDVKCTDPKLAALGVWLDGRTGVSVDCMSSRGYSGVTLAKVNTDLCHQMAGIINYDLIVLEFGINAMTAKQTDYTVYANKLVEVINHVRSCYPSADILLMGIGDRGEKIGGAVKSMRSAPYMVEAQRTAARRAHCLFWDTRSAMGGDDAIVRWSGEGKANKDYIHLTHKGGAELAQLMFNAMQQMLK